MSITQVATNNTPPTFVAKPYRRTEDDSGDNLPKVAVKERRINLTQEPPKEPEQRLNPGDNEDTWKKRYGDLRRHAQETDKANKLALKELQDQLNRLTVTKSTEGMPKTPEEVEAWKEQYKDSYDIIVTVATTQLQKQIEALQAQIDSLKMSNEETEQERAAAVLTTLVPNWRDFDADLEFKKWLAEPHREKFRTIVYDGINPHEIAEVLNMYMAVTGKKPGKAPKKEVPVETVVKPNVDAALSTPTRTTVELGSPNDGKNWIKESEVARLSGKDYEKYEEIIEKARREGTFIYDISGKAQ